MRMFKWQFILVGLLGVFLAQEAYSQEVEERDNDVIDLRLKAGVITEASFPANIANVTKSVPSELLHIETLGKRMYLLARENFHSSVHVVTEDNLSYSLSLAVNEAEAPGHVEIKKTGDGKKSERNKKILNTIRLIRALIKGELFQNAALSKAHGREIFNNGSIRITIDEIYESQAGVKAIVLTFENLINKPIVVPVEHISLPGLLAISVENQILEARSGDSNKKPLKTTTKAYMIVEGLK